MKFAATVCGGYPETPRWLTLAGFFLGALFVGGRVGALKHRVKVFHVADKTCRSLLGGFCEVRAFFRQVHPVCVNR
jgi:hypothetical protein